MSGDYHINAVYGGIQDYQDTMSNIHGNMLDSQDGCRQIFNALQPIMIGSTADTAQQSHHHHMNQFDQNSSDWLTAQRQYCDQ
ncbi:MAG: hypothetical protein J2P17_29950, partial [Mycobacterium sp.]|nr:hypothetical protein [Mycobacterium sp.]